MRKRRPLVTVDTVYEMKWGFQYVPPVSSNAVFGGKKRFSYRRHVCALVAIHISSLSEVEKLGKVMLIGS